MKDCKCEGQRKSVSCPRNKQDSEIGTSDKLRCVSGEERLQIATSYVT